MSFGIFFYMYFILEIEVFSIFYRKGLNKSYFFVLLKFFRFLIERFYLLKKISNVCESLLKILECYIFFRCLFEGVSLCEEYFKRF